MYCPGTRALQMVSSDCLRYQDHPWIVLEPEHGRWSVRTVADTRIMHGLFWNLSMANNQFGLSEIPGSSIYCPGTRAQQMVSSDCLRYQDHPWIVLEPEHGKRSVWTFSDTRIIHRLSWNQSMANSLFGLSEVTVSSKVCPKCKLINNSSSKSCYLYRYNHF